MNRSRRIRRRRHDHLYRQIRRHSIYAAGAPAAAVIATGHSAPCTQNRIKNRIICVR
jgi:hypothetical protein